MPLPTQIKQAVDSLKEAVILLVGEKNVGKTSFLKEFNKHYIMEFECGNANWITGNWEDINSPEKRNQVLRDLVKNPSYCNHLGIDNVQMVYEMYMHEIMEKEGVWDLGGLPHGRGWGAVRRDFRKFMNTVQSLNCGVWYTAHISIEETAMTRDGLSLKRMGADLMKAPREELDRQAHGWLVMLFGKGGERNIWIQGDDTMKAGHKFKGHFKLIKDRKIPMGDSEKEAMENFVKAWNNEPLTRKVGQPAQVQKKTGLKINIKK